MRMLWTGRRNAGPAKCRKHVSNARGELAAECGNTHSVTEEFCNRVKQYYDEEKEEWMIR